MGKRILITGAAGFIGYHLALHLKARGDFVIGLDNFNTYYDLQLKKNREEKLLKAGIEILHADIRDRDLLQLALLRHNITHWHRPIVAHWIGHTFSSHGTLLLLLYKSL